MKQPTISDKQLEILKFPFRDGYRALICDGAVRSGKTSVMTVAFVDWAMREFNNTNFAICGKTVGSAIKNVITPYMALTYHRNKYSIRFTRSDNKMTVQSGTRINTFYVYGGKDDSSYMLIQGITLAGVMLDEVALMTKSFVEEALARCLSFPNRRYWFNCNPGSPSHWFYNEWILQPEKHDALYLHFLMTDNPSMTEESIRQAEQDISGVFYERRILGKWKQAEGVIYRAFADDPEPYIIEPHELPALDSITIGVDFGGNRSRHAFVASGLSRDNHLYVLQSVSIPADGVDVDQLIRRFQSFAQAVTRDYGYIDGVYCDSAEQTIINTIRARTDYPVYNSIKRPIVDRIRATLLLMGGGRLHLVRGRNDDLAAGLRDAVWDGKSQTDKRLDNGTSDIDILDAFEYSWEYYLYHLGG